MGHKNDSIKVRMMSAITLFRKDFVSNVIISNDNNFEVISPIYSTIKQIL